MKKSAIDKENFCDQQFCIGDLWLFRGLEPEEKRNICNFTRKMIKEKGEHLFLTGEQAETLFLIKKGKIKLYKTSESGKELILDFLGYDGVVGEDSLFLNDTYSMNAAAVETTHICACSAKELSELLSHNPQISMKIISALGQRLQATTYSLESMAIHDVRGRIVRLLLRLAEDYGRRIGEKLLLDFKLTHEEIAAMTGASRVMVSTVMGNLRKSGLLRPEHNHTYSIDIESLKALL